MVKHQNWQSLLEWRSINTDPIVRIRCVGDSSLCTERQSTVAFVRERRRAEAAEASDQLIGNFMSRVCGGARGAQTKQKDKSSRRRVRACQCADRERKSTRVYEQRRHAASRVGSHAEDRTHARLPAAAPGNTVGDGGSSHAWMLRKAP